jgi:acetolactate synthase-1/2/3 large subunit
VAMTLMGLGGYDQTRPESLDMVGMHGAAYANFALQQGDLLVAVGARFDDRVTGDTETFAPKAKIVHIDIDPSNISKTVRADIPIVGDAQAVLAELTQRVVHRPRTEWFAQIALWKSRFAFGYDRTGPALKPQQIIEEICRQTRGRAIITTGVGQHQMWTAQFYKFTQPRHFISSGGLGTMGFGLPAAIGAQIARPDALVIDIDGDHSFNMTMAELITAVAWRLPIKICIMNNGHMGMVRQWQELFYEGRYAHSRLENPDYAAFARAIGAGGITVTSRGDVPAAVARMLAESGPCLLDFHVEAEENVWPMVPAGSALHEMKGLNVLEEAA